MEKIILLINHFIGKLNFLSGNSLSSTAQSLGIQTANTSQIGQSVIPAIQKVTEIVALIGAVGAISLVAILIITARRQETRTEAMGRIPWIGAGLFIALFAAGIVGYLVTAIG
ncbi:hypothetical protein [Clostridium sp.]|uniref:hypothetical protein n=1 Tax=Clostridium sp. TaxID=1506 RepID=UPI0039931662